MTKLHFNVVFIHLKYISFGIMHVFWVNVELALPACGAFELFKSSAGSGCQKLETAERMDRHHTLHYIIDYMYI